MMNHIADSSGWLSGAAPTGAYVVTKHAAIASIAIVALMVMLAQLLPRSGDAESQD